MRYAYDFALYRKTVSGSLAWKPAKPVWCERIEREESDIAALMRTTRCELEAFAGGVGDRTSPSQPPGMGSRRPRRKNSSSRRAARFRSEIPNLSESDPTAAQICPSTYCAAETLNSFGASISTFFAMPSSTMIAKR